MPNIFTNFLNRQGFSCHSVESSSFLNWASAIVLLIPGVCAADTQISCLIHHSQVDTDTWKQSFVFIPPKLLAHSSFIVTPQPVILASVCIVRSTPGVHTEGIIKVFNPRL